MARRGKDGMKIAALEIQDGARTPRAAVRQRQVSGSEGRDRGPAEKLAQYARTSPPHGSKQGAAMKQAMQPVEDKEGEGSDCGEDADMLALTHESQHSTLTTVAASSELQPEPTLRDVFQAVAQCNASLSSLTIQLGALKEDIGLIRHDIKRVSERTTEVETRMSELEDSFHPVQKDTRRHNQQIAALEDKADDLENRLRRNNVRLVGVPEKVEGRNPTDYFESWLQNTFGKDVLTPIFAVERAHRVPTRPLPPGAPPRPVLVKVLHFKDRDIILRKARELSDIRLDGNKIAFYPDFSVNVQKRRAQFHDVKRRLRDLELSYAMLYPAKLRVVANGTTHFFENPKDAIRWLDQAEHSLKQQSKVGT